MIKFMCWSNTIAIPLVLKKPLKVYKVGCASIISNAFISLFQNFMYLESQTMPTIEIKPEFIRSYNIVELLYTILGQDTFYIYEGYHSYLTKEMAKCRREKKYDEIGVFEIPVGATIYVNYKYKEVVSTDIKYLGLLES